MQDTVSYSRSLIYRAPFALEEPANGRTLKQTKIEQEGDTVPIVSADFTRLIVA